MFCATDETDLPAANTSTAVIVAVAKTDVPTLVDVIPPASDDECRESPLKDHTHL